MVKRQLEFSNIEHDSIKRYAISCKYGKRRALADRTWLTQRFVRSQPGVVKVDILYSDLTHVQTIVGARDTVSLKIWEGA